jgi:inward rectifier potassium channel
MTTERPEPSFDPGLTQQYSGALLRAINKDGSFNVRRRRGFRSFAGSAYMHLVIMTWPRFLGLVVLAYLTVNLIFAGMYWALDAIRASVPELGFGAFPLAFFFSVHTLTTVGYGDLYPVGLAANVISSVEAAIGLMGFALATGLLFARFSRPSARLAFGARAIVAPYGDAHSLQFRLDAGGTDTLFIHYQKNL